MHIGKATSCSSPPPILPPVSCRAVCHVVLCGLQRVGRVAYCRPAVMQCHFHIARNHPRHVPVIVIGPCVVPVARHGPVYTLLAKGRGRALTISHARPKCHRLHTTGCPSGSAPHRFGRYRSGVDLVTVCFHNGGKAVLADDLPGVGIKRDRRPAVAVDRERVPGFWHFANSIGSHPDQCGARCMIQN
jgi:hypothetical protein